MPLLNPCTGIDRADALPPRFTFYILSFSLWLVFRWVFSCVMATSVDGRVSDSGRAHVYLALGRRPQ